MSIPEMTALLEASFPLGIDSTAALVFLIFCLPVCIWVGWNDMKFMKIPNQANYALIVIFLVTGLLVLPFTGYLWGIAQGVGVLVIGFILNQARALGAGDAKFAAAAAPFFHGSDFLPLVIVFASVLLAAFATHRLFRLIPAMRRAFPDWRSWDNPKFPMGLALGGCLALYLLLGVLLGN